MKKAPAQWPLKNQSLNGLLFFYHHSMELLDIRSRESDKAPHSNVKGKTIEAIKLFLSIRRLRRLIGDRYQFPL
jgi:hypothetical protein